MTTTTVTADRIREAAKVLREKAQAIVARDHNPGRAIDNFVDYYEQRRISADTLGIDAAYIATMHPGVGLALADWLDNAAEDAEMMQSGGPLERHPDIRVTFNTKRALGLADLILGGA